jgi:small redox-active disulfide protein 2
MLTIKVLGPGCANCKKLEEVVRTAVASLQVEAQIVKVTDMQEIIASNVLKTPGLVINDKLVSSASWRGGRLVRRRVAGLSGAYLPSCGHRHDEVRRAVAESVQVPRCTTTSPADKCTSWVSSTRVISPSTAQMSSVRIF